MKTLALIAGWFLLMIVLLVLAVYVLYKFVTYLIDSAYVAHHNRTVPAYARR